MVLLFLLSLLLAWPTYGISLIAFIAFAVMKSSLKAKTRIQFANEQYAERSVRSGEKRLPTWAGDPDERHTFLEVVQMVAMHEGVPQTFLWAVLQDKENLQNLIFLAGSMERGGGSFVEQGLAACNQLVNMWEQLPEQDKDLYMNEKRN